MRCMSDNSFVDIWNKNYNSFDDEMASVTVECFKKIDNPSKGLFIGYFEGMMLRQNYYSETEKQQSNDSLLFLKEELTNLKEEYREYPFKLKYTESFISVIDKLRAEEKMEEEI